MEPSKLLDKLQSALYIFYLFFLVSIIWGFRAETTIAIALIFVAGFWKNRIEKQKMLTDDIMNLFVAGCSLYYLFMITALAETKDIGTGFIQLRIQSGLFIIPLALGICNYLNSRVREKLMRNYVNFLLLDIFFCLVVASVKHFSDHSSTQVFFYHELVSTFGQNAVQSSILTFIGLAYLLESAKNNSYIFNRKVHAVYILFFIIFILLLSSKLIIVFTLIYLIYFMFRIVREKRSVQNLWLPGIICIAACSFAFFTANPVSGRFRQIFAGNIEMVQRAEFDQGVYFNGLQFRLLQWRFTFEILNENHSWLTGVSPGDAQDLLNKKYIEKDMYTGPAKDSKAGFIGYNTHNQFLQSLLNMGVLGLLAFILSVAGLCRMAFRKKQPLFTGLVILLICYSFSESVFENQYGLMIFVFFPLFFYAGNNQLLNPNNS